MRSKDRLSGLEMWRALATYYHPKSLGITFQEARDVMHPPRASSLHQLGDYIVRWENALKLRTERTGHTLDDFACDRAHAGRISEDVQC